MHDSEQDQLDALLASREQLQHELATLERMIGKHLRTMRLARDLSLREAGSLLGCDHSNLRKVEKGHFSPTMVKRAQSRYQQIECKHVTFEPATP